MVVYKSRAWPSSAQLPALMNAHIGLGLFYVGQVAWVGEGEPIKHSLDINTHIIHLTEQPHSPK